MATTYRIVRYLGGVPTVLLSGLSADDATLTINDAPPSAGTYSYTLEVISDTSSSLTFHDTRVLSMVSVLQVKK